MAKPRFMSNFSRENSMSFGLSLKSMPILIFLTADTIFSTEMHGLNQRKKTNWEHELHEKKRLKEEKIEKMEKRKSDYHKKNAPLLNDCKEIENEVAEQNGNEPLWQIIGKRPIDAPVFKNKVDIYDVFGIGEFSSIEYDYSNGNMYDYKNTLDFNCHDDIFDSGGAPHGKGKIFVTAFMRAKNLP